MRVHGFYTVKIFDKFEDKVKNGVITIKATDPGNLEIKLRSNGENYTSPTLKDGEWVFDRSKSGETITERCLW